MQHPYSQLQPEYSDWLAHLQVTRPRDADAAAKKILLPQNMDAYQAMTEGTRVPPAFVGVLELREDDCDPSRALGQGDRWDRVSVNVPRGLGPFASRVAAGKFYVKYEHLDDNSASWTLEYECWKGEIWNGLGPRAHGRRSGYLLAGTSLYDPPTGLGGKYVSDGQWSPGTVDQQIGIVPVLLRIGQLRPDLAVPQIASAPHVDSPPLVPAPGPSPLEPSAGGPLLTTWQVQHALNEVYVAEQLRVFGGLLREDGNYGRKTRGVVRAYQISRHLGPDGLSGPETDGQLSADYKSKTGADVPAQPAEENAT